MVFRARVAIRAFRRFAGTGHADLSVRAVGIFHAAGLGVSDTVAAVAGFAITAWMLIIAFEPAAATQMTKLRSAIVDFAALVYNSLVAGTAIGQLRVAITLMTVFSVSAVRGIFTGIRYTYLFIAAHARPAFGVLYAFWHNADAVHATLA